MDVLSPFISVLCHSDWLPWGDLFTYWCCPFRPFVVFLACVHLALFLALSLSPGNFLVSFVSDITIFVLKRDVKLQLTPLFPHGVCFLCCPQNPQNLSQPFHLSSQRHQVVFLHSFWVSNFYSRTLLQATLALSLVVSLLRSVCCDFSIFSAVMPRLPASFLTWYGIPSYTHHLL